MGVVKDHPAETAGPIAMAFAMLIGKAFGWDMDVVAALAIVIAFVPAIVTYIVNQFVIIKHNV